MKRIKAINGYTIYEASEKDEAKYNVEKGYFYIYCSSDIRDFGLSLCDYEHEAGSYEEACSYCVTSSFAIVKEICEAKSTAVTYEDMEEVEKKIKLEEEHLKRADEFRTFQNMTDAEYKEWLIDMIIKEQLSDYFVRDELVEKDTTALSVIWQHLEEITS